MMEMAIKALRKGGAEIGKGTKIALKETERLAAKARTLSFRLPGQSRASLRQRPPYIPPADFILGDGGYEITIDLPGLELKDISVKLSGDHFTIRGERRLSEIHRRNASYLVHERRFGIFARSFHIPRDADASRSEATFDRGILKIWIPKYSDTIEVRSS